VALTVTVKGTKEGAAVGAVMSTAVTFTSAVFRMPVAPVPLLVLFVGVGSVTFCDVTATDAEPVNWWFEALLQVTVQEMPAS
jgi:hypothetical protein